MEHITAPVIILGMHRSGTSCLAGSLQYAGLVLGDVHTANPHNKKGNREHPEVMALHESILAANGGSWHHPPRTIHWHDEHRTRRDAIAQTFANERHWGFKDPRTLLVVDGWRERFSNARFVASIRHPLSVALSLQKRNRSLYSREEFIQLWAQYNRHLLTLWREKPFPVIDFDNDDQTYRLTVDRIARFLGLGEYAETDEQPFFEPELRRHREQALDGLPQDIAELYLELKEIAW